MAIMYLEKKGPFSNVSTPDIIILDLKIPKIDGLEVLKFIKNSIFFQHIPVVVLSTSDAEFDKEQAYSLGANSYLVKPIDSNKFKNLAKDLNHYWSKWNQSLKHKKEHTETDQKDYDN